MSLFDGIGSSLLPLAGAAAGAFFGGPTGAQIGASLGGAAAGAIGAKKGSEEEAAFLREQARFQREEFERQAEEERKVAEEEAVLDRLEFASTGIGETAAATEGTSAQSLQDYNLQEAMKRVDDIMKRGRQAEGIAFRRADRVESIGKRRAASALIGGIAQAGTTYYKGQAAKADAGRRQLAASSTQGRVS